MSAVLAPEPKLAPEFKADEHTAGERPITVLASFTVAPERCALWEGVWTDVARAALQAPGCRAFRLLTDRNDGAHRALVSTWDSAQAFNAFVRGMNWLWLERVTCSPAPTRFAMFEAVDIEPTCPEEATRL